MEGGEEGAAEGIAGGDFGPLSEGGVDALGFGALGGDLVGEGRGLTCREEGCEEEGCEFALHTFDRRRIEAL